MRIQDLRELVESTADASFAIDGDGLIAAWNAAAERLFGISADEALEGRCGKVVRGTDECGAICSDSCTVLQAVQRHRPLSNFDMHCMTADGGRWCNVSVLSVRESSSGQTYSIHVFRPIDARKRLEMLVTEFVVAELNPMREPQGVTPVQIVTRTPSRQVDLSARELEVLLQLSRGSTTRSISAELHISVTTVNNHIQNILRKLDAHTRLEAIRRAEHAGLI